MDGRPMERNLSTVDPARLDPQLATDRRCYSESDVDLEAQALSYHSGSSSNSSLSTRSLESPSNSLEAVSGRGGGGDAVTGASGAGWDSDTEVDAEPPDWKNTVPEDVLKTLSAHEVKRQEVINELFQTERSHVRGLKVLDRVFYRPMKEQQVLPPDQISLLFANLEEMLDIHSQFNNSMKVKRKEGAVVGDVGDLLYSMFEGSEGEQFQQAAATFCARQQIALEALKEKRRKDPKLNSFLTDAEVNPVCRRLQLKDIIPSGMLRLTKYPLLLKNLEKYTASGTEEAVRVQRAEERSREILNYVNEAVKEAEDQHRLSEIQRRLDKVQFDSKENHPMAVEFKNLDLTRHRLIHEGPLIWRIANRPKLIDVHVLLLEDVIILLQKQDDRYILKFYSSNLSPVIKMSTVIVRPNAVDKKALFLVNTAQNQAQIYDLISTSRTEMKVWFKHISDAAEAYKTREGKHRRQDTASHDDSLAQDKTKDEESGASGSDLLSPPRTNGADDAHSPASDTPTPLPSGESTPQASPSAGTPEPLTRKMGEGLSPSPVRRVAEPLRQTTAESSLIEPSEVLICQSPVLTAEPVLTPLEKLRRTDEVIRQALEEKKRLVADILHVPRDDFDNIAELAAEPSKDKDAREIVLAAVNQANKLWSVVNDALRVTEEEAVSASVDGARHHSPGVSPRQLHQISQSLNTQLSLLLDIMTAREEERERLREEVQKSREQLHALYERQQTTDSSPQHPVDVGEACASMNTHKHVSVGTELTVDGETGRPASMTPTTPEVFVDALSGEAESHLEAAVEAVE